MNDMPSTVGDVVDGFDSDRILRDVERQTVDSAGYRLSQQRRAPRLPGLDTDDEDAERTVRGTVGDEL